MGESVSTLSREVQSVRLPDDSFAGCAALCIDALRRRTGRVSGGHAWAAQAAHGAAEISIRQLRT